MKKIILLSDTHSYMDEKIIEFVSEADQVWHAGDIGSLEVTDRLSEVADLKAVYGNIDSAEIRTVFPKNQRFNCEKVDVWMTHIGGYPNRYKPEIKKILNQKAPKLFICGHSHILKVIWDKKYQLLHMNPGAVGKYGFHQLRTMLRFEIMGEEIKNLEVIELAKR